MTVELLDCPPRGVSTAYDPDEAEMSAWERLVEEFRLRRRGDRLDLGCVAEGTP